MRKFFYLLFLLSIGGGVLAQSTHEEIKSRLMSLSPLVGDWNTESRYESRTGKVSIEKGTASISWALDSTYLKWTAETTNRETGRQREYMSWITFDKERNAYRQTYMYSRSANVIIEYGQWSPETRIFSTEVTLNLPDGTVEQLRNEIIFNESDKLVYKSWAKFDDAQAVQNYTSTMTRK